MNENEIHSFDSCSSVNSIHGNNVPSFTTEHEESMPTLHEEVAAPVDDDDLPEPILQGRHFAVANLLENPPRLINNISVESVSDVSVPVAVETGCRSVEVLDNREPDGAPMQERMLKILRYVDLIQLEKPHLEPNAVFTKLEAAERIDEEAHKLLSLNTTPSPDDPGASLYCRPRDYNVTPACGPEIDNASVFAYCQSHDQNTVRTNTGTKGMLLKSISAKASTSCMNVIDPVPLSAQKSDINSSTDPYAEKEPEFNPPHELSSKELIKTDRHFCYVSPLKRKHDPESSNTSPNVSGLSCVGCEPALFRLKVSATKAEKEVDNLIDSAIPGCTSNDITTTLNSLQNFQSNPMAIVEYPFDAIPSTSFYTPCHRLPLINNLEQNIEYNNRTLGSASYSINKDIGKSKRVLDPSHFKAPNRAKLLAGLPESPTIFDCLAFICRELKDLDPNRTYERLESFAPTFSEGVYTILAEQIPPSFAEVIDLDDEDSGYAGPFLEELHYKQTSNNDLLPITEQSSTAATSGPSTSSGHAGEDNREVVASSGSHVSDDVKGINPENIPKVSVASSACSPSASANAVSGHSHRLPGSSSLYGSDISSSKLICYNNVPDFDDSDDEIEPPTSELHQPGICESQKIDIVSDSGSIAVKPGALQAGNVKIELVGLAHRMQAQPTATAACQAVLKPGTSTQNQLKLAQLDPTMFGLELTTPGLEMLADDNPFVAGLTPEHKMGARAILEMFPGIDPTFVVQHIRMGQSVDSIAEEISSKPDTYPRLQNQLCNAPLPVSAPAQGFTFSIRRLLQLYPDPEIAFMDVASRPSVSAAYIIESKSLLERLFPALLTSEIQRIMKRHQYLFLPTASEMTDIVNRNAAVLDKNKHYVQKMYRFDGRIQLNVNNHQSHGNLMLAGGSKYCAAPPAGVDGNYLKLFRKTSRPSKQPSVHVTVESLFWEYNYYLHKNGITERRLLADRLQLERIEAAREVNALIECECCFLDECLPQHMVYCEDFAHSFCKDCVKKHTAASFEQGKCIINCIYGGCQSTYSVQILRRLLEPKLFDALLRRLTQFEVKQADLEDLVACPFCDFMVIMPNAEDKIVKCLNVNCRKESCRLCKEIEHLPFKCGELDSTETGLRTFVENKMAEAMMRTCPNPKCSQRIIKIDGCNKMSCPCGTYLCYVCNETLTKSNPYAHFNAPGAQCSLHNDLTEMHDRRALEAGQAAMTEYLSKHPGLRQAMGHQQLDLQALVGTVCRAKGKQ